MTDRAGPVALQSHRDDVEATAGVFEAARSEIVLGQADEPASLLPRHGLAGAVAPVRAPALHLDEDDRVTFATDEIDLALAEPDVALENGEPGAPEAVRRGRLGRLPD